FAGPERGVLTKSHEHVGKRVVKRQGCLIEHSDRPRRIGDKIEKACVSDLFGKIRNNLLSPITETPPLKLPFFPITCQGERNEKKHLFWFHAIVNSLHLPL